MEMSIESQLIELKINKFILTINNSKINNLLINVRMHKICFFADV